MELWIRVQKNKELKQGLVKVEDLMIDKYSDGKWCICQSCDTLGIYKTEKRALEVLDEIQRLITDLQYMSYAIPNDKFTGYRPNVYEMPKE